MSSPIKKVTRLFAAVVLAGGLALGGCASNEAAPAASDEPASSVKIAVVGPDASGADLAYVAETAYALDDVADAWDLSQKAFDGAGLTYDASNSDYGVMLNSITNPLDGTVLAWDEGTGKYWQLFVDGAASEVGIDGVELADGMSIVWYYSAYGDAVPDMASLPILETLADAA